MAHLTGAQDEKEKNMPRIITAREVKAGMRINYAEFGWDRIATVLEVKYAANPDTDYVAIWSEGESGARGAVECIKKHKEIEVLEEAPLPPEPGVGSTVEVDEVLFNHVDDDNIGWRGVNEGGYLSWCDLHELGEVKVLFDIASTKPKPKPELGVGDQLAMIPEDGSKYEGYVFHTRGDRRDYMAYTNGGWGWSFGLDKAKAGNVIPYLRPVSKLNATYAPLTVVSVPEGK